MDLAVKSPRPDFFATPEQKEDFTRECESWINLGLHPNIVSCYYVRTLGRIPRVFAEYVEGGTLSDWIRDRSLYAGGHEDALERILDVAIQFASGLQYAHEQGLIHQDVKPANVVMTPEGIPKVTDFGLANARAATEEVIASQQLAQTLVVAGCGFCTREYASPEQLRGGSLTRRTDLWSWAVSVLQMFSRQFPAVGEGAPELLEMYLEEADGEDEVPKMPDGTVALLRQCLKYDPDERPRHMLEVIASLKKAYRQATGHEYPREDLDPAELLADGLNNRAVSLLDIGKREEAEAVLEQARRDHPAHARIAYNWGLSQWRAARLDDVALVTQLEDVSKAQPGDWTAPYCLGLVHVERGDTKLAQDALAQAASLGGGAEPSGALNGSRSLLARGVRDGETFDGHSKPVYSVVSSADGQHVLSASGDETLRLWDVSQGRCVRTFNGHNDSVLCASMSADGQWALN